MDKFLNKSFSLLMVILTSKLPKPRFSGLICSRLKQFNPLKLTTIFLVNCFLLSFVYGQTVAQVVQNAISTRQFKEILQEFILPHSYGKITDSKFTGNDTVVINVQDLHLHPHVQKNIGNIIELFDKKYGIKNVYLEGCYGRVDTSWLTGI